jgi:hypothetical protein
MCANISKSTPQLYSADLRKKFHRIYTTGENLQLTPGETYSHTQKNTAYEAYAVKLLVFVLLSKPVLITTTIPLPSPFPFLWRYP